MITKEFIRMMSGNRTYNKGVEVYNGGKVVRFSEEENADGLIVLEAQVKGSGRNWYEVYLLWDPEWDELVEADCECPAFYEYEGICKHCVAVLLAYYYEIQRKVPSGKFAGGGRKKLEDFLGVQKGLERKTTESIQKLLKRTLWRKVFHCSRGISVEKYG